MKIIVLLCQRVRWLSDRAEQLNRRDLPGRLANTLPGLTETCRFDAESRTIAITQQEVSEMVGMSRESINKQLGAWALRKWVRLEHRAIVVLDASALQELAEGPD
jgi:CRP-like cAMP-binding protein